MTEQSIAESFEVNKQWDKAIEIITTSKLVVCKNAGSEPTGSATGSGTEL